MAKKQIKKETEGTENRKITFRCPHCEQDKPLEEMRAIRRFFPMLVVCRDCEKTIR